MATTYDTFAVLGLSGVLSLGARGPGNVAVTDDRLPSGDSAGRLGDVPDDRFTAPTGLLGAATVYTYVGTVSRDGVPVGFVGSSGLVGNLAYTLFVPRGTDPTALELTLLPRDQATARTQWDLDAGAPVCFLAGTLIRTPAGEVPVESLRAGDLVTTAGGAAAPVLWMGRCAVSARSGDPFRVLPVRVRAGALADNVPARDLLVSACHALLVGGALVQADALVNGASVVRDAGMGEVLAYHHIELADHALVLAENTPAETYVDNVGRLAFDNAAEHEALFPEGRGVAEMALPRAKALRQVPLATRRRLQARADALFGPAEAEAA